MRLKSRLLWRTRFNGNKSESALISYVARVNYDYDNKYLIGASIRRDGSSRFSEENLPNQYFPALFSGLAVE